MFDSELGKICLEIVLCFIYQFYLHTKWRSHFILKSSIAQLFQMDFPIFPFSSTFDTFAVHSSLDSICVYFSSVKGGRWRTERANNNSNMNSISEQRDGSPMAPARLRRRNNKRREKYSIWTELYHKFTHHHVNHTDILSCPIHKIESYL